MNIHIELVKKWLADPTSVTQQELEDNRDAAEVTDDKSAVATTTAFYAANASYDAAYAATATAGWGNDAAYWVKRYEELTK